MQIHTDHLRRGRALAVTITTDESITVLYGEGGGCVLNVHGEGQALFIPLLGSVHVTTSIYTGALRARKLLVTEKEAHARVVGSSRAKWIAVLGGMRAWARILVGMGINPASGMVLLPSICAANNNLRRKAIAVARAVEAPLQESIINAMVGEVTTLQAPLHGVLLRCPGRTHAKRLSAFLRLQRVRNHIINCCDQELNNDVLAQMANYSPCHFLGVFERVFRETPHELLVNERLRLARSLLHSSKLAIAEIAVASGFESRSAFSRLFHQRFGSTANEERRRFAASFAVA